MKLFTRDIDKKLFAQYPKGASLENQVVVAKIFNPYGAGRWYLLNSDPSDPDYLWAIVQINGEPETGSVSRKQLENIRVKPFNLPLERDLYFSPINALELYQGLLKGKIYKAGGMTEASENKEMLLNQAEEFEHHSEEFESAVKKSEYIPAWVVAKSERASTDLSDITHYLDGENEQREEITEGEEEYADGGEMENGGKIELFNNEDLIKLLKSINFKTFKSSDISEINYRYYGTYNIFDDNFYAKIYADPCIIIIKKSDDGYNIYIGKKSIWQSGLTFEQTEYSFKIKNLTFKDFEEGLKNAVKNNLVTLYSNYASGSSLNKIYYYGSEEDAEKFALEKGYKKVSDEKEGHAFSYYYFNPNLSKYNNERFLFVHRFSNDDVKEIGLSKLISSSEVMAKGGEISVKVGDRVRKKVKIGSGVSYGIDGIVYEVNGRFFKLKDKYGNESNKLHDTSDFKQSDIKSMASGGMTDPMATVNEIARLSGVRPIAIAEWGDKNNINLTFVLKDLKSKKIKGMDIMTAIVGNPSNKYQKELSAKYSKMADGGMMAKGGEVGVRYFIGKPEVDKVGRFGKKRASWKTCLVNERGEKNYSEYTTSFVGSLSDVKLDGIKISQSEFDKLNFDKKMAMGGKVKFADKVKSIKSSLLKRKKVSPKVQKDYGKTYSPKEAEESAKRIVGAMTAKERLMAKRKKSKK
jgi:hypothetical protein